MTQIILAISFALLATAWGLPLDGEGPQVPDLLQQIGLPLDGGLPPLPGPLAQNEDPETRIQGGRIAKTVPDFIVGLVYDASRRERDTFCTASLVGPSTVITAAHCTKPMKGRRMWAVMGLSDLREASLRANQNNENVSIVEFAWDDVVNHEGYIGQEDDFRNDIAIINLPEPVKAANNKPITLASAEDGNKVNLKGSGWGMKDCMTSSIEALREADATFVEKEECKEKWGDLPAGQICIKYTNEGKPASVAQGDSGGPLFSTASSPVQLGLVSYGRMSPPVIPGFWVCMNRSVPQIYTSIPAFKDWITDNCSTCKFT